MDADYVLPLDAAVDFEHPHLQTVVRATREARDRGAARILMMGAHVIKMGVSRHLIDLLEKGVLTHIAMNGAGAIHDYELARIGGNDRKRGALYPARRVRAVARDRPAQ